MVGRRACQVVALWVATVTFGASAAASPPPIFAPVGPVGNVTAAQADKVYQRARKGAPARKRLLPRLAAASDARPEDGQLAGAVALALAEQKRWCDALRYALRATPKQAELPARLRKAVFGKRVLPRAFRKCAQAHDAKQAYGVVRLDVTPPGAEVEVGGVNLGKARLVALPGGRHTLLARAPGKADGRFEVTVQPQQTVRGTVKLAALGTEPQPSSGNPGVIAGVALSLLVAPPDPRLDLDPKPAEAPDRTAGIALLTSGAIVLVAGAGLYAAAHVNANLVFDGIPSAAASGATTPTTQAAYNAQWRPTYEERVDEVRLFEALGWVGLGLGAALLVGGGIAMALANSDAEATGSVQVGASVDPDGGVHATLRSAF